MTLAKWSLYLFYAGALTLTISFVLHVIHTTVLAARERLAGGALMTGGRRLAGAGVGSESTSI